MKDYKAQFSCFYDIVRVAWCDRQLHLIIVI